MEQARDIKIDSVKKINPLKIEKVSEIKTQINQAKSILVFEYHGLTVSDLNKLRNSLSDHHIQAKVYKNRLFKIAATNSPYQDLNRYLTGPNMFVFGDEDAVLLIKKVFEFAKEHQKLQLKAATYEGKIITGAEINEVAILPSHDEALTKLIMTLLTPLRHISLIMNEVKNRQEA